MDLKKKVTTSLVALTLIGLTSCYTRTASIGGYTVDVSCSAVKTYSRDHICYREPGSYSGSNSGSEWNRERSHGEGSSGGGGKSGGHYEGCD